MESPNETWTIWDECVMEEIEDLKAAGIPKDEDEKSLLLWRVWELQVKLQEAIRDGAEEEFKNKYDIFGNLR